MIFFQKSFLFVILIFSISCWGPSKRAETLLKGLSGTNYNQSTFRIAEVNSSSVIPILKKGEWKVPYSLRYKFKVKVISQKDARSIIGHEFYIKTEDGKLIKEITKASGWLEWHEDISFNFFSNKPSYLVLKREIIGRGLHQGSYFIEIATNPWAVFRSKYPNFVHLDKKDRLPINLLSFGEEQVRQSKIGFSKSIKPYYPLDMSNAKVFISQLASYNKYQNLEVKLEMNLLAKMKDAYGENILYKLKHGRVRAFVSLMATNMGKDSKEHAILFHSTKPLLVQFTAQDRAIIAYKGTVYNQPHKGNLAIAIRLVPEGVSLAPFEALYSLGSYRKLFGSHSLILEENSSEKHLSSSGKAFSYTNFLRKSSNIGELKKKRYLKGLRPFRVKRAKVLHQGVLPGETALRRTVGFRTKICLEHAWVGSPVVDEHFIVNFESKKLKTGSYYTDEQGCLSLVATVSHKIYKPQKYFLKSFHIYHDPNQKFKNKDSILIKKNYKRFNQKVSVYLNPWDERIGNFGFDVLDSDKEYIDRISQQNRIPSKFFIQRFSYNTLGFKYTVDDHLNLEIKKRLQLVLQPYVLRYHSLSFGRDEFHRSLRDGVYLMKVAFQKTYLKPDASGVTISAVTNKEQRVQSVIQKIPLDKQNILQSYIDDLKNPDKVFLDMSITGFTSEELASINLENLLLATNKEQAIGTTPSIIRGKEYVTAYQKLIKVQNGLIIEPVALKINNPILMKIRGQLLIQLEPVDEKLLQVARLADLKISNKAKDFLNKTINTNQAWDELSLVRSLSNDKKKIKSLKEFVNKQQAKLIRLINLLKQRSLSLKRQSKNHLNFSKLPEELKQLLDEFSFMQGDFDEIEENNFIHIKGKSILDPNIFVAKDSGLTGRTFIAPVTLVMYDNNSYMRPTDSLVLNSCGKGDCLIKNINPNASLSISTLINKAEAIAKLGPTSKLTHEYFEHENRLAGVSVDDLIRRQKKLYSKEKAKNASFSLYTQLYGLDYISNYSILEKKNRCFKEINFAESCNVKLEDHDLSHQPLVPGLKKMNFNNFKKNLNKPFSKWRKVRYKITHLLDDLKPVAEQDIQNILETGKIKKHFIKARFCRYITNRLSHEQLVDFKLSKYVNMNKANLKKKKAELKALSKTELKSTFLCDSLDVVNANLHVSSFYKIYKVNSNSASYTEGQSFNVNVGTTFGLKQVFSSRMDLNPISDPARLLGIGGLGGLPYRLGFTKGVENSFTLNSQVLLSIQESAVAVDILAYKKCTVVRLSDISRGVVLCGKLKTNKKRLSEKYYYISQHFTPGDQLDMGALYNHPWLLRMRGARDILVFLNSLRRDAGSGWRSIINTSSKKSGSVANPFTPIVDNPLNILESVKESYSSFLPGFPSHYQILD